MDPVDAVDRRCLFKPLYETPLIIKKWLSLSFEEEKEKKNLGEQIWEFLFSGQHHDYEYYEKQGNDPKSNIHEHVAAEGESRLLVDDDGCVCGVSQLPVRDSDGCSVLTCPAILMYRAWSCACLPIPKIPLERQRISVGIRGT